MQRALMGLFTLLVAAGAALAQPASLPEEKRTTLGLYVTATEAYDLKRKEGAKALFIDIRSRAEAAYVGMPTVADALVPLTEPNFDAWDDKRGGFAMQPNKAFVQEVERRLAEKGLSKANAVIVMCRSGDRSARAINDALAPAGFTRAYTVVDGFEGDMSGDGRRSVNGWKNAGLPWTYKLDRAKQPLKG
ncbi:MAG TPA: rhodanese-like domain-containing protein [Casimicrobiaceae bacterium]|nr:rhodanese-like domain-containing protein [Casimicrobiaceae bacterium]